MRLLAPAKINLFLRVGARSLCPGTGDGFHPLVSWMCTVGLFDTLILESRPAETLVAGLADAGDSSRNAAIDARPTQAEDCCVSLHCDDPALPTDGRNLIVRAAQALAAEPLARLRGDRGETSPSARRGWFARDTPSAFISLTKCIPSGGGLGGGSSDAASTLLGLAKLWNLDTSMSKLAEIAARLGSDVPFFLFGPSSICTGRGEIVQPIPPPACRGCVLILPRIAVPTPAVYKRFDELQAVDSTPPNWSTPQPWHEWTQLSALDLLPRLANDLETPAYDMHPELRRLSDQAATLLDRPVRMSGSGSSLFTLFDTVSQAEKAANILRERLHIDSIAVTLAPKIADDLAG